MTASETQAHIATATTATGAELTALANRLGIEVWGRTVAARRASLIRTLNAIQAHRVLAGN